MNDVLSILNSKENFDELIKELKDAYHIEIDAILRNTEFLFSANDELDSIITGFKTILNTCYDALFLYNSNSKSIKSMWLNNELFEHVMISTFYTVQYLTETRFVKASYLLNEEQPSMNSFTKKKDVGNYTILNPERGLILNRNHAHTEKIRRHISSLRHTPKGKLFNCEKICVNKKESEYIQLFLPYFSYICSDIPTSSGLQAARHDFTKFSIFTKNSNFLVAKEMKRSLQLALESLFEDYRYLLDLSCDHYSDTTNPERILFFYKLYRHFPVEALSQALTLLPIELDYKSVIVEYCKLPNVFSRAELLYSVDSKEMEAEFLYLREILLPLYEKLFFVVIVSLYKQDFLKLKKIFSDIFRSYNFRAEWIIEECPIFETKMSTKAKIKSEPYKHTILAILKESTERGEEYKSSVLDFASIFYKLFTRFIPNKQRTFSVVLEDNFNIPEPTKKAILLRRIQLDNKPVQLPQDEYYIQRSFSPLGIISPHELNQLYIADYFDIIVKHYKNTPISVNSDTLIDYLKKIIERNLSDFLEHTIYDNETCIVLNTIEKLMYLSQSHSFLNSNDLDELLEIINKRLRRRTVTPKQSTGKKSLHTINEITPTFASVTQNSKKIIYAYNLCVYYLKYLGHIQ